jgi:hypothetical protein
MYCSYLALLSLLHSRGCKKVGIIESYEVWMSPEHMVIRFFPEKNIHLDIVEEIALNVLGMGMWDWDYWLGENCIQ